MSHSHFFPLRHVVKYLINSIVELSNSTSKASTLTKHSTERITSVIGDSSDVICSHLEESAVIHLDTTGDRFVPTRKESARPALTRAGTRKVFTRPEKSTSRILGHYKSRRLLCTRTSISTLGITTCCTVDAGFRLRDRSIKPGRARRLKGEIAAIW